MVKRFVFWKNKFKSPTPEESKHQSQYLAESVVLSQAEASLKKVGQIECAMADQPFEQKRCNLRNSSQPAVKRFKSSQEEQLDNWHLHSQSCPTSFLNLNEDCLFETFKYLSLSDLCNLTGVCTTLQTLSKKFFSHEYGKSDNKYFQMVHKLLASESTTLTCAQKLLRNFGEYIEQQKVTYGTTEITATSTEPNHRNKFKLLQLITKYCKNLTTLTVHAFEIKQSDVEMWKTLFANLTRLNLMYCKVFNMSFVLSICSKLKYLKLDHTVYENLEMLRDLEVIKLTHCFIEEKELMDFIRANKNLVKLSIIRCPMVDSIDFKEIVNLKNLREFELNQHLHPEKQHFEKEIQQLSQIDSLEKLSLNCYDCSVSSLIANLVIKKVSIQHLHLTNGPVSDQMINDIARLTSINTLKLHSLENKHLIKLTSELKSLVELDVKVSKVTGVTIRNMLINAQKLTILRIGSPDFKIDDKLYDKMLDIVKNRCPELKLKVVLYDSLLVISLDMNVNNMNLNNFNDKIITVSREKIKNNSEILEISTMNPFIMELFVENLELDFDTGDELEYDTENDDTEDMFDDDSDDSADEMLE